MPAHIDSMAYVGQTPWHKLGRKLASPPSTVAEMIAACGLGWAVQRYQLGFFGPQGQKIAVDRWAIVRSDNGEVLGTVGPTYRPAQNVDAFAFFEPFIASGQCRFETGGSLMGGARVWMLAELNRAPSTIVPGDEVRKFLLLANGHDGSLALRVGYTPVRVVCDNTLSAAVHDGESRLLSIRHTDRAIDALKDVQAIVNLADQSFEASAETYRSLARKGVTAESLKRFLAVVFPKSKANARKDAADKARAELARLALENVEVSNGNGRSLVSEILDAQAPKAVALDDVMAETEADQNSRAVDRCLELFEHPTNTLPGVRGTLWAALNAVTHYTSHERGRGDESRAKALMGGDGAAINARALAAAVKLAN